MNYTIYMVNCNSITHVICSLTFTTYKYNELQMSFATQFLSYKANCKTHIFLIVKQHHGALVSTTNVTPLGIEHMSVFITQTIKLLSMSMPCFKRKKKRRNNMLRKMKNHQFFRNLEWQCSLQIMANSLH
jgi:hypothetical protein